MTEARGDIRRGIEVVEYACGAPELLKGESLENIAPRDRLSTPSANPLVFVSVFARTTSARWSPMWMYPMALACGNTFVFKPSEKVPLTGIRLIELLIEAGLPKGVLNIVHGGKECVDALLTHETVRAISFVGSSRVAKIILKPDAERETRSGRRRRAKNFVFVLPDADVGKGGSRDDRRGVRGARGQRCMAASTAVVVGGAQDEFHPAARSGGRARSTSEPPTATVRPAWGAVITREHLEQVNTHYRRGREGRRACDRRTAVAPRSQGAENGFYLGAHHYRPCRGPHDGLPRRNLRSRS